MMAKRLLAGVLCVTLTAQAFSTISHAATVKGEGSASTETDFDTTGLFNNDLIVMIPDEVPLTLNEESGRLEGKGFVTAWGNASARAQLFISTDKEITYAHEDDSSITVGADVSFGDEESNTAVWDAKTLNSNISAEQKVGEYVTATVPFSEVDNIGTYRSNILFNISLDATAGMTYYMGYRYVASESYTDNDINVPYEMLESGDTVAELQAFSLDKEELVSAGYDKIVASSDKDLAIPSQIGGLDVVGVSFDSFFSTEEIATYVRTVALPDTVEGIELTEASESASRTVITSYNYRTSVNVSKTIPSTAKIRFAYQDTDLYSYRGVSIDGIDGYTLEGFSSYGVWFLENCNESSIMLQFPDTYRGKPVLQWEASSRRASYPEWDKTGITDMEIVLGENFRNIGFAFSDYSFTSSDSGLVGFRERVSSIVLNDGLKSISASAFNRATALKEIVIPDSVTFIGENAFYECTNLKSVTIPSSAVTMGPNIFWNCTSLEEVTFGDGFAGVIGYSDFWNTAVKSVTIPASTMEVQRDAFRNCESLEKVTFAEGFKGTIGDRAFYGTTVREVSFPSSLLAGVEDISSAINFGAFDKGVTGKFTFDSNSDEFNLDIVWNGAAYYSFRDKDFICRNNKLVEVPKGLMNDEYNFEFTSDESLNECSEDLLNCMKGFQYSYAWGGCIVLGGGITDIGINLQRCRVSIPSTLETLSYEDALYKSDLIGTADVRGIQGIVGDMRISSAEKYITNSSMLTYSGQINDSWYVVPRIAELYIEYDSIPSGTRSLGFENIGAMYFSGTEEEWAAVSKKLDNWSSFKGEIHYNASF